jgi:single-stranded DNA-binding protein
MRLAVNDGPDRPLVYVDAICFERQAEACAKHLATGRQVAVSGRLHYSEWKAGDGSPRSKHEVIGRVQFLGRPSGAEDEVTDAPAEPVVAGAVEGDDGIPF